jgi:hypothetical protein
MSELHQAMMMVKKADTQFTECSVLLPQVFELKGKFVSIFPRLDRFMSKSCQKEFVHNVMKVT